MDVGRRLPGMMRAKGATLLATVISGVVLLVLIARIDTFAPVDLANYATGAGMLLRGQNPYGPVEFFLPPWSVVLLWPLALRPLGYMAGPWMVLSAFALVVQGGIVLRWCAARPGKGLWIAVVGLSALSPAAIFCYVTGQVSPLVALATLVALRLASHGSSAPLAFGVAVGMALLKPNLTLVPITVCLLEIVRMRRFRYTLQAGIVVAAFLAVAFAVQPSWPSDLAAAWMAGAFRGGPGLAAAGHRGLIELGVPPWLLVPALAYVARAWMREHLSLRVVALSLTAGLLVTPYARAYDLVLLTLPALLGLISTSRGHAFRATVLLLSVLVLPLTPLWMLAPVGCLLGLIVGGPRTEALPFSVPAQHAEGRLEWRPGPLGAGPT